MRRKPAERGYTLIEAIVVMAIIGMISLVAVPNFIAMRRAGKVKGAVQQFTSDLRAARQRAVTTYRPVMVSIGAGAERNSYWIYNWNGTAWGTGTQRNLESTTGTQQKTVYFANVGYPDSVTADGANRRDIIFETNGGVKDAPAEPTLQIKTDEEIAKPVYTISIYSSGSIRAD
jgi:prepilin-type N-terminal cleavage/methylation domain-containing protein